MRSGWWKASWRFISQPIRPIDVFHMLEDKKRTQAPAQAAQAPFAMKFISHLSGTVRTRAEACPSVRCFDCPNLRNPGLKRLRDWGSASAGDVPFSLVLRDVRPRYRSTPYANRAHFSVATSSCHLSSILPSTSVIDVSSEPQKDDVAKMLRPLAKCSRRIGSKSAFLSK